MIRCTLLKATTKVKAWFEPPEARSCGQPIGFSSAERTRFQPPEARQEPSPTYVFGTQLFTSTIHKTMVGRTSW